VGAINQILCGGMDRPKDEAFFGWDVFWPIANYREQAATLIGVAMRPLSPRLPNTGRLET